MNNKPSFVSVVHALSTLSDEELASVIEKPELLKEFASKLLADNTSNTYVVALSDNEAVKLLVESKKYNEKDAKALVAKWRKIAAALGYTGPVAWKVKAGYTLKDHASLDNNSYSKLGYLKEWKLKNDESTKDSIVFWVPRLVDDSTSKTIPEMEKLHMELRRRYKLPAHHATSFGSIALLFALILAHFKRTGERVPLKYLYAASDTFRADGHRLIAGFFGEGGLDCSYWGEDAFDGIGFFLLGVELGQ